LDAKKYDNQSEWERIRWQTFYLLNIQMDKKHRLKKLQDLCKFEWEINKNKVPSLNQEQIKKIAKKWQKGE
jgi:hypothetical protein